MKSFQTQLLEVARKMTRRRQEKRSEKVEERRIREVEWKTDMKEEQEGRHGL